MGIDRDAFRDAVGVAEDNTRGLAPDPLQFHRRVEVLRDLAPVIRHQRLRAAGDALRLRAEEPRRPNDLLDLGQLRRREVFRGGITGEERGRHRVHPLVRALGGEDGGDQEFERVAVVEFAIGVGIDLRQPVEDRARAERELCLSQFTSPLVGP